MNHQSSRIKVPPRESAHRQQRALIVKFGQIGDVIMAIPAVRALYDRGFEIHWVCGRAAKPLLECYPWIHLIPADDGAILRGNFYQRTWPHRRLWGQFASVVTTCAQCCTTIGVFIS